MCCWLFSPLCTLPFCSVYEKKCISRGEAVAPATQSKLSRVSSGFGLSKLTGVRRNKKENSLNKNSLSAQVRANDTLCTAVADIHKYFKLCVGQLCFSTVWYFLSTGDFPVDVHTHCCCSRPGGHAVQGISRGTTLVSLDAINQAGWLEIIYQQHILAEKTSCKKRDCYVTVLQDSKPNKHRHHIFTGWCSSCDSTYNL